MAQSAKPGVDLFDRQIKTHDGQMGVLAATAEVLKSLGTGHRICVLGGTSFHNDGSEKLTKELAEELNSQMKNQDVVFVTGGMAGVQQIFAENCDPSKLFNIVPIGEKSAFSRGKDVSIGENLDERKMVFGQIGHVYVTVEGGPGVAQEARDAFARGALLVPMVRSGGASAGKFEFPPQALLPPQGVDEMHWRNLESSDVCVTQTAQSAASIICSWLATTRQVDMADAFELNVFTLSGEKVSITTGPNMTIADLLSEVAKSFGMGVRSLRLAANDGVGHLDETKTVGHHGLTPGTVLTAVTVAKVKVRVHVYHARGGAPPHRGDYLIATEYRTFDFGKPLKDQLQLGKGNDPTYCVLTAPPDGKAPAKWSEEGPKLNVDQNPEDIFDSEGHIDLVALTPMIGVD